MDRIMIAALGLALAACSKTSDAPPAAEAPDAKPMASAVPAPSSAPSGATSGGAWSGHYAAGPGSFSVPDGGEWAGVRFRGEDASVGLGDGTLTMSVDPAGHLQGTLEGALGPLRVMGELAENEFSAALVSSDPGQGFSGTAVGTQSGDRITGTMRLSLPTGNVLREAPFSLERKR